MKLTDEQKNRVRELLSGRALYIALSALVLTVGVFGISRAGKPAEIRKTPAVTEAKEQNTAVTERITVTNPALATMPAPSFEPAAVTQELPPETRAVFEPGEDAEEEEEETTAVREQLFTSPLSLEIGQDYSMGVPVFSATMSDYRTHNGVDFLGVEGDNVYAVSDGDVLSVKKDAVWGNSVTVDHGNGVVSTISGLADEIPVSEGAHVYRGTVVGRVGRIPVEAEEASHVHLEIRADGKLTDPLILLGLSASDSAD